MHVCGHASTCGHTSYLVVVGEYEDHLHNDEGCLGQRRHGQQNIVAFGDTAQLEVHAKVQHGVNHGAHTETCTKVHTIIVMFLFSLLVLN